MKPVWMTYDPEDGFEEHRDEMEGRAALRDLLEYHQDTSSDGVHEQVERVALFRCERIAHIRKTVTATAEDDTDDGRWCRERGWDFKVELSVEAG